MVRRQVLQFGRFVLALRRLALVAHGVVHFLDDATEALVVVLLSWHLLNRGRVLRLHHSVVRLDLDQAGSLLYSLQLYVRYIILDQRRFVDDQSFVQRSVQDGRVPLGASLLIFHH